MTWTRALLEHPLPVIQWGIVVGASLVATCTDLWSRRIPNALTLPLFAVGVAQAVVLGGGGGLVDSLTGSLVLACPYVILFVFAGGGAGDAKLMGAIGAWLGIIKGAVTLASVSLSGVALALLVARARKDWPDLSRWLAATLRSIAFRVGSRRLYGRMDLALPEPADAKKMAYAPAISLGVMLACTSWYLWHA